MPIKTRFTTCRNRLYLALTTLLLIVSCTPPLPPADPTRAAQLRNEGLKFELRNDFIAATRHYMEATRYDPHNSSGYLKLAEFQEAGENPQAALKTYDRALNFLPKTDPDREFILYRSALLLAGKLNQAKIAQTRLKQFSSPVFQSDLAGVIALHQNESRPALKQFQSALKHAMTDDQFARIYFHVAQAYVQLGDEVRSRQALLIAVSKATSRDLKEEIKRFFEAMLTR